MSSRQTRQRGGAPWPGLFRRSDPTLDRERPSSEQFPWSAPCRARSLRHLEPGLLPGSARPRPSRLAGGDDAHSTGGGDCRLPRVCLGANKSHETCLLCVP